MIKKILLSFSFMLSFTILFSCSKLETGLQLAPRVVSNRIDDAFEFKSEKLGVLRGQIEKDIGVNKKGLALKLISHIDTLLEISKKEKMSPDEVRDFIQSLKATQATAVQNFKPSFEVALNGILDGETTYFKQYIDKKFSTDLEVAQNKTAFLNKRKKSVLKTYGYFLDEITEQQEKLNADFVERNYAYFVERIKIRKTFAENFHLRLVSKAPTVDFAMTYYAGEVKDFSSGIVKAYLEDFYKFQADFWNLTSPKERENFRTNLNGYKDELKKIAGI